MIEINLKLTDEQFKMLDLTGLLNMDMAGLLWESFTITTVDEKEDAQC